MPRHPRDWTLFDALLVLVYAFIIFCGGVVLEAWVNVR